MCAILGWQRQLCSCWSMHPKSAARALLFTTLSVKGLKLHVNAPGKQLNSAGCPSEAETIRSKHIMYPANELYLVVTIALEVCSVATKILRGTEKLGVYCQARTVSCSAELCPLSTFGMPDNTTSAALYPMAIWHKPVGRREGGWSDQGCRGGPHL